MHPVGHIPERGEPRDAAIDPAHGARAHQEPAMAGTVVELVLEHFAGFTVEGEQRAERILAARARDKTVFQRMGAVADGLIDVPQQDNKCISPGHLVALVNYPNHDYHWYRKGSNGKWSHKMGGTPATILDNSGNPIADPRIADRGAYTNFCTFMQVIHGHFKIDGIYD